MPKSWIFNTSQPPPPPNCAADIPDKKEILSKKCLSENKWWWWLRDFRRDRGRDEKNLEWQHETREEQDPTQWGAREAVCSAAWLTHNRSSTARAPPRGWRNRAQYCEQTNTPVQMHNVTGRNTQRDINTHRQTFYCCHVRTISVSKDRWGIYLSIFLQQEREAKSNI